MTRKKKTSGDTPNGKGGELRDIDDEWRENTRALMTRYKISIRELARRAGCSHAILVAALDPTSGKNSFSWCDAIETVFREEEANPARAAARRERAPRAQHVVRDVPELDENPFENVPPEERRNILAGLVRTMPQAHVDAWLLYVSRAPTAKR